MKRAILISLIVVLGIAALFYPTLSYFFAERNSSRAVDVYETELSGFDQLAIDQAWDAAEAYNESLTGSPVHDPFIEGSGMAMPDDYARVLDVNGIMGYIEIPKINVNLPIYHGTGDDVLTKGIGHLEGSTLPIGGIDRHSVLTGHCGLANARLFTDLTELDQGDHFFISILGQDLAYQVDKVTVIEPYELDELERTGGKDYCTLMTCTPYGINSHRLLVRGTRVEYNPAVRGSIGPVSSSHADDLVFRTAVITTTVMAILIVITFFWTRQRHQAERDRAMQTAMSGGSQGLRQAGRDNSPVRRLRR